MQDDNQDISNGCQNKTYNDIYDGLSLYQISFGTVNAQGFMGNFMTSLLILSENI